MNEPRLVRLDRQRVARAFDRAADDYDAAAVLQRAVRAELLERLQYFKLHPAVILDLGAGTAQATGTLCERFPDALAIALDIAPGMLRAARARQPAASSPLPFATLCADALRLPLRAASVSLAFSNLMLQWCDDLDAALGELRRALAPGGLFVFSTFGPGTLRELRAAWASVDAASHISDFPDMHELGAALTRQGFADPVLDVDHHELSHPDVRALMRELKAIGARNATAARPRTLTGRSRLEAVASHYERWRRDGMLPSSWEVIYGAAFAGNSAPAARATEIAVPLAAIGRRT